jgi:hypothetical protein
MFSKSSLPPFLSPKEFSKINKRREAIRKKRRRRKEAQPHLLRPI